MFGKVLPDMQGRMMTLKHHAMNAFHTGRSIMGKADFAYQTLRKLHQATMPVLKDTPLGPAMSHAGKAMASFEQVRNQALNAGNIAEAVVHRAKRAAPELF
jgi:hypothetical protein